MAGLGPAPPLPGASRTGDHIKAWLALLVCLVTGPAAAQNVVTAFPEKPDPAGTYVIYLHGRVVENLGPRPTESAFGLYDYPAILEALASRGATVISNQRPAGTNVNEYAGRVVARIEDAIHNGVPPANIVVVGFSRGGDIAIHVSSLLRRPQVRHVLLAACWPRPGEP